MTLTISGGRNALAFSRCMRSHGLSGFPDPNGHGQIEIGPSSGVDPAAAAFQSARRVCQPLIGSGEATPAVQAKARREALAFSACMRSHGVPDYPDPTFAGNSVHFPLDGGANSDLNSSSPTFQTAEHACGGFRPKGPPAAGAGGGK